MCHSADSGFDIRECGNDARVQRERVCAGEMEDRWVNDDLASMRRSGIVYTRV